MTRMCAWCAQAFIPRHMLSTYCSPSCVDAAIEENKMKAMLAYARRSRWYEI